MPAAAPARLQFAAGIPARRRSLISLTPLIDVVFILLVFFMLASSFADWRAIDLTPPATAGEGEPMTGAVLIDVRADGVRMSGVRVTPEQLRLLAERHVSRDADRLFIVRPVAGVELQAAIDVMDSLSVAGVERMSLAAGARQ
jgi:biopolymer transport protein ExbD